MASSRLQQACPLLFLGLVLASSLFLVWNLPPFMAADELAHVNRANLVSFGRVIGERVKEGNRLHAGGPTDSVALEVDWAFDPVRFHPEVKVDAEDYAKVGLARWDGRTAAVPYPGSAVYPPFLYLPSSLGLVIGRALDWPVVQTLYLARALNALACAGVGFLALSLAGRSRLFLYSLLLLPMSVGLYSAVTPDGLIIVLTALGCAFVSRAMAEARPMKSWELLAAAECFALVGMAKIPYAAMSLVLLAAPATDRRWRLVTAWAPLVISLAWTIWMAIAVQTQLQRPDIELDPGGQARFLLSHPAAVFQIAWTTLSTNWSIYGKGFVGILGWADTLLPGPYYPWAGLVIAAAALLCWRAPAQEWRAVKAVTAALALVICALVFGALYIAWTGVGALLVEGVHGRYLLPVAVLLALVLEGERPAVVVSGPIGRRALQAAQVAILVFPAISMLLVERAIILRYYLD